MEQITEFNNVTGGVLATVYKTATGYTVSFRDTDADAVIGNFKYPADMYQQAVDKARSLVSGVSNEKASYIFNF